MFIIANQFKMFIKGDGVRPDTVGVSDLAQLIRNLEEAIEIAVYGERERVPGATPSTRPLLSLVSIQEGESSDLTFIAQPIVIPVVSAITEAIEARQFQELPLGCHEKLVEISKQATRNQWSIEIPANQPLSIHKAVISIEHPIEPPSPQIIEEPATVWGLLVRVGGHKPKALLRLPNGKSLSMKLTKSLAKQLGGRLYEIVEIEGTAKYQIPGWEVVTFKANAITPFQPQKQDILKTFEHLREVSEGRWKSVNVEEFVRKLRSEG